MSELKPPTCAELTAKFNKLCRGNKPSSRGKRAEALAKLVSALGEARLWGVSEELISESLSWDFGEFFICLSKERAISATKKQILFSHLDRL